MRKITWIFLLVLCVLMTACSDSTATKDTSDQAEKKAEQKQDQQKDVEKEKDDKKDKEVNKQMEVNDPDPEYKVSDIYSVVPIDDADEKVVLLTIDDAPDKYALEMAKTLKKLDVNAIFFVNGHFLETPEQKKRLKKIHDMGFMIGNHTYSHAYLPDLSKEEQKKEVVRVDDMVEDIIGEKPKFFRAPNGANTDYTEKLSKEEGMILMNWSYGYDWNEEYMSKDAITDIMLNTELLTSGATLLMHDREWTSKALKDIVTGLQDKGYEMVDPKLIKTR